MNQVNLTKEGIGANTPTLKSRYDKLAVKRSPYLTRAKEYSRVTLPYLLPDSDEVRDESDINTTGWQSFGAQVVNHLSNKIIMTLFPPSRSFFKLDFETKIKKDIKEAGYDSSMIAEMLAKVGQDAMTYMDSTTPRDMDIRTAKQLVVTGNYMHYYPEKGGRAVGITLQNFVCTRDTSGNILEVLISEKKALNTMKPEVQKEVLTNPANRSNPAEHEYPLITSAKRMPDGFFELRQEVGDVSVGKVARLREEDLPFTILRWNYTESEHYGRGLVEDNASDFYVVQMLSEAIVKGMVIMADIKYLVKAGSYTDIDHLLNSPTGEYIEGNIDDVGVLQLNKYADFKSINEVLEKYQRRIGQVFLMNSAARRDKERVTAYEVRQDASELETSLGGIYSHLSESWQKPRARILLARALENMEADLNLKDFDPKIITGIEALGRLTELDKIMQLSEVVATTQSWSAPMLDRVKWDKLLQTISAEIGLDTDWLMSEDEYQEKQQAAQEAQQQEQLTQTAAESAPQIMEAMQ